MIGSLNLYSRIYLNDSENWDTAGITRCIPVFGNLGKYGLGGYFTAHLIRIFRACPRIGEITRR